MQDKKQQNVEIIFDGLMSFWKLKTFRELAEKLDIKEGTLNAWKSRGKVVRPELIVEKCPGVSFEWAATGNGEMFTNGHGMSGRNQPSQRQPAPPPEQPQVPNHGPQIQHTDGEEMEMIELQREVIALQRKEIARLEQELARMEYERFKSKKKAI